MNTSFPMHMRAMAEHTRTGSSMWYVIQVFSGQEHKACELINKMIGEAGKNSYESDGRSVLNECFVPRYQIEQKFRGEYRITERNLFPGYVIAVTDDVESLNRALRGVSAFTKLLGNGEKFLPLDKGEMGFINSFTSKKRRVISLSRAVDEGDAIRVIEGPFVGCEGWIKQVNRRKGTARIETTMFGRTIEVEIGLAVMTKAE